MSVRCAERVWEKSTHGGTALLMMLAIADFADDDGNAYPSVGTLAEKCRMSVRNANHLLASLRDSGELDITLNAGPRGCNRYRVRVGQPLKPASPPIPEAHVTPDERFTLKPVAGTPEAGSSKPLKPASDEPSLNRQEPSERARKRAAPSPSTASRGARLSPTWTLSDANRVYCRAMRPDLDPDAMAENFRDYWVAATGKPAVKCDWSAAWRMWVRREGRPRRMSAAGAAAAGNADTVSPSWLAGTGFADVFAAESAGCGPGNASKFRNGTRVAV